MILDMGVLAFDYLTPPYRLTGLLLQGTRLKEGSANSGM